MVYGVVVFYFFGLEESYGVFVVFEKDAGVEGVEGRIGGLVEGKRVLLFRLFVLEY